MNLSSLSATDLKRITALLQKRDALQAKVETLNAQIDGFSSAGKAAGAGRKGSPGKTKPAVRTKRGKRGQLAASVLATLKEAGAAGVTIKDIAAKVGRDTGAIHSWFFNAKKTKVKGIKKVGEAKWAWVG